MLRGRSFFDDLKLDKLGLVTVNEGVREANEPALEGSVSTKEAKAVSTILLPARKNDSRLMHTALSASSGPHSLFKQEVLTAMHAQQYA